MVLENKFSDEARKALTISCLLRYADKMRSNADNSPIYADKFLGIADKTWEYKQGSP